MELEVRDEFDFQSASAFISCEFQGPSLSISPVDWLINYHLIPIGTRKLIAAD